MKQTASGASIETDARTETSDDRFVYQADPDQPLSVAVISAIAAQSDLDMVAVADEFEPLYNVIDPTALDSLFDSSTELDRAGGSVTFTYAGHTITVDTTGRVVLDDE